MKKIEILVVEDDPGWGRPLKAMYESVFDDSDYDLTRIVRHEAHGRDAHALLQASEPDRRHLLSLDINLRLTHPTRGDGTPDIGTVGACGLDLLKLAAAKNACRSVVVITGAAHDETIRTVTRNEGELAIIEMSLEEYVRSLFPGRYKLLRKLSPEKRSVSSQIEHFRTLLTAKELLHLCRPQNEFLRENGGVWRLSFARKTARLQELECLAGLRFIQHLLKYPNQEFTALALERFDPPGEQRETTEEKEHKAQAFDSGLTPGRTGFERLLDERGPSHEEKNSLLDTRLREMSEWFDEATALHEAGQEAESLEARQKSEKAYNDAMALATLLQKAEALTKLKQVSQECSFEEYWQSLAESVPQVGKNNYQPPREMGGDEEKSGRFQRTLPQKAADKIARAVKQALEKINECHPELVNHLRFQTGIQIGTKRCVYSARTEAEWFVANE
jgi:DNA-binding NarL/FixJ family response regulator